MKLSPENSPARREAKKMWERAKWACKREAEGMKKEVPANATDATNPDEEKEDLTPKEKMDKRMALLRQRRVQKRVQVEMDKVVAKTEAMEELADGPVGPGTQVSAVASSIPEADIAKLSTDDEVMAAKKRMMEGKKIEKLDVSAATSAWFCDSCDSDGRPLLRTGQPGAAVSAPTVGVGRDRRCGL